MSKVKETTRKIFDYLREHREENLTAANVADALDISKRSVDGSFTSFQTKGWGIREEAEIETEDGKHQKVKYLRITDAGMAVDLDAPQE